MSGAARGLGWAISEALSACGAQVAMTGRTVPNALPKGAFWIDMDVANESQVVAAFNKLQASHGRLDVLVNNAGISGPSGMITEMTGDQFEETLRVNLMGTFLCAREAARLMLPTKRGRIINISSLAGVRAYSLRTPYASSKWGMIGLTRSLATELGPYNIQVNAICPGAVEGERVEAVIARRAAASDQPLEVVRKMFTDMSALGRFVRPADIADTVLFLCSPAGENITGVALEVTAGAIL